LADTSLTHSQKNFLIREALRKTELQQREHFQQRQRALALERQRLEKKAKREREKAEGKPDIPLSHKKLRLNSYEKKALPLDLQREILNRAREVDILKRNQEILAGGTPQPIDIVTERPSYSQRTSPSTPSRFSYSPSSSQQAAAQSLSNLSQAAKSLSTLTVTAKERFIQSPAFSSLFGSTLVRPPRPHNTRAPHPSQSSSSSASPSISLSQSSQSSIPIVIGLTREAKESDFIRIATKRVKIRDQ
jgi:hypothetical protein